MDLSRNRREENEENNFATTKTPAFTPTWTESVDIESPTTEKIMITTLAISDEEDDDDEELL